jgi:transposase
MSSDKQLQDKYSKLLPFLDEKSKRLVLAADAASMGRGGLSKVSSMSGVSRVTLNMGIKELQSSEKTGHPKTARIRKPGGGRKKETEKNSELEKVIEQIVSPHTAGDPMNPLLWTSKSLRNIAEAVKKRGYKVSHKLVGVILKNAGYSLQGNRKTDEGGSHEDRDAQFHFINDQANEFLAFGDPVISVDCKKKELIGNFKNDGEQWLPQGNPTEVKVYDFIDKQAGKAIPYGVYDIANNEGWVSVGISHDTAGFAVATIRSWWDEIGKKSFEKSKKILITADGGGGSNSARSRLWKKELQLLADQTAMEITVSHFPPGTSKWNKIEHRLFSHISMNWRAKPLTSLQIIVDLIGATKTAKGLKVRAKIDTNEYETAKKVTEEELQKINIIKSEFHGEWNYTIKPNM